MKVKYLVLLLSVVSLGISYQAFAGSCVSGEDAYKKCIEDPLNGCTGVNEENQVLVDKIKKNENFCHRDESWLQPKLCQSITKLVSQER